MEWLTNPEIWTALVTLILLEHPLTIPIDEMTCNQDESWMLLHDALYCFFNRGGVRQPHADVQITDEGDTLTRPAFRQVKNADRVTFDFKNVRLELALIIKFCGPQKRLE
jgi:hypothetical protein